MRYNTIQVAVDDGSNVVLDISKDHFHEVSTETELAISIEHFSPYKCCPRCGGEMGNALSRRVNVDICDYCGVLEAIEDFTNNRTSLKEWYIVKSEFNI